VSCGQRRKKISILGQSGWGVKVVGHPVGAQVMASRTELGIGDLIHEDDGGAADGDASGEGGLAYGNHA
jgi:hypothetical protein